MVWLWAVVAFIALAVELFTFEFVAGWISLGALIAFVLELCKVNIIIQISVFVLISFILIFTLRKLCLKKFGHIGNDPVKMDTQKETKEEY